MERIAIIGCGGSGKTHLARQLAGQLSLPLIHLDALYYDADWRRTPRDAFEAAQERLVAQPRWVIEGNYVATLPVRLAAADTVILLDVPARTCLRSVLQRRWRHRGGQHPSIGVYDRITWGFIQYIVKYRRRMLPRVHSLMDEQAHSAEVIVVRGRAQAQQLLQEVVPSSAASFPHSL